jgi:2-desacetyl-2-hydroxyethyl bacteriochlorophyllide A dehydrogenase
MTQREVLYFQEPYKVEVRVEALPVPGPDQVLVETAVSAISPGTEMLFYRGQVPPGMAVDSGIAALQNDLSYPLQYGYASVGRVISLGQGVDSHWLGRMVFLFHPHESHFVTAASNLYPLPKDLPAKTAVFLPLMETAVSFLMDGRPMIGERVVVLGQGIVGLLTTTLLAQYPLATLVTLDHFPLRRRWSHQLGAHAALDPGALETAEELKTIFGDERPYLGADLVYELTGNPHALNQAIDLAGYEGRILIGSWYGQKQAPLDLGDRFHRNHLRLISSQVSSIAPRWRGRFDQARRLQTAWSMLARHRPEKLITHRFPLAQAGLAYDLLDQTPESAVQIIFTYNGAANSADDHKE